MRGASRLLGVPLLLWATIGCGLSGCATEPPVRLYVLTPVIQPAPTTAVPGKSTVAVGIGPVQLPQYTSRPAIVTEDSSHELHSSAFAQWAEPLQENFVRVTRQRAWRETRHVA